MDAVVLNGAAPCHREQAMFATAERREATHLPAPNRVQIVHGPGHIGNDPDHPPVTAAEEEYPGCAFDSLAWLRAARSTWGL
jgi:hypothetical protein